MTEESNVFQRAFKNFGQGAKAEPEPSKDPVAGDEKSHSEPTTSTQDEDVPLSQRLLEDSFHPVLIFGTRATGKTTFLTSMLAFFTSMPEVGVTVTLGDQLSHSDAGIKAHESAERLFHLQVNDYIGGTAPLQNQETYPFFVPLELRKSGLRSITKVALMDSTGEIWNVKDKKNNVQDLRAEITDIYQNYPKPLSVLMVVPYAVSEGYTGTDISLTDKDEFKLSDASLLQTLQTYRKYRPPKIEDHLYFILTKWDMHTQMIASKEFLKPEKELVAELVRQRFPQSYGFLRAMSPKQGTICAPYSAGLIGGTKILEVPKDLRPLLHDFPFRLWGWIYSNATGGGDLYGKGKAPRRGRISKFIRELLS